MKKAKNPKVMGRIDVASYLDITPQYVDVLANKGELEFQETTSGKIFFERDVIAYERKRVIKRAGDKRFKEKR
ncbi:MAG: hypothetical protein PHX87_02670 [Candidatus Peribacteraceae bacterium]|nr:hypothetical protein [Candidatus Peribacteraceae bacterium]